MLRVSRMDTGHACRSHEYPRPSHEYPSPSPSHPSTSTTPGTWSRESCLKRSNTKTDNSNSLQMTNCHCVTIQIGRVLSAPFGLYFSTIWAKSMSVSLKELHYDPPPSDGLTSQSTQQPRPVCLWSAHAPQSGPSPLPFPRYGHTLTATATAAGELFLFGGWVHDCASSDLHVFSTRDFSTTLLQTSGEVPTPRATYGAALIGTTLLICGGTNYSDQNVLNHDSPYLLNLGTLVHLMTSPASANYSFALQYHESGPALWSTVLGSMVVSTQPQPWSVPSSSSSVVRLAGSPSMICGHSI